MKHDGAILAGRGEAPPPLWRLAALGAPIVFVAYAAVLAIGGGHPLPMALTGGLANTLPTVLFGAVAYRIVTERLAGRRAVVVFIGHAVLAAAYALACYWLLTVLLGAANDMSLFQFRVEPFPARASAWQLLQNLTTYGIVAAVAHLNALRRRRGQVPAEAAVMVERGRTLSRFFIRKGDDIQPIDVDAIVSIAGADDYAEVSTLSGRHLVRITMAELEKTLDPAIFIRVHRSRIVNAQRIARAEPAGGGRLLLHMEDGEAITASRSGSRLLKDRML